MTFPSIVNWPVAKMEIDIVEARLPSGFAVLNGWPFVMAKRQSERTRNGIAGLTSYQAQVWLRSNSALDCPRGGGNRVCTCPKADLNPTPLA